jgi:hypothetical protein
VRGNCPAQKLSHPPETDPDQLAILPRHVTLKASNKRMNEIQKFLHEKSVEPYGVGMLTPSDAIEFVNLCMRGKVPIYGIDGFHRRVDKSPAAIQIDQRYSTNYSNVTTG